jgi:hypothetical protein
VLRVVQVLQMERRVTGIPSQAHGRLGRRMQSFLISVGNVTMLDRVGVKLRQALG